MKSGVSRLYVICTTQIGVFGLDLPNLMYIFLWREGCLTWMARGHAYSSYSKSLNVLRNGFVQK